MAKSKKRTIGDLGEDIACNYLIKQGCRVVERNYLRPWGEIDIVIWRGKTLCFVEVKSVSCESLPSSFGGRGESIQIVAVRPEENMHKSKLEKLHRAIQTYLVDHKISENVMWQIDLVCVYIAKEAKRAKVELFENIVL